MVPFLGHPLGPVPVISQKPNCLDLNYCTFFWCAIQIYVSSSSSSSHCIRLGVIVLSWMQVFSERVVVCPSILSLSVWLSSFVNPTQAIEIFGNVSTPFGTLTICLQNFTEIVTPGNSSVEGELNTRGAAEYSDYLDLSNAISRKRCKIRALY